jgi:hypothetical protein
VVGKIPTILSLLKSMESSIALSTLVSAVNLYPLGKIAENTWNLLVMRPLAISATRSLGLSARSMNSE